MKIIKLLKQLNLLLLAAIIFISCKKEEKFIEPNLIGNWIVVSFNDDLTGTKLTKAELSTWPQFNNGDISVKFESEDISNGEISGINVTNTFNGKFQINTDSKIIIENVLWTEKGEPLWGQLFHSIQSAETYELNYTELKIFYNQNNNSITLIKQ